MDGGRVGRGLGADRRGQTRGCWTGLEAWMRSVWGREGKFFKGRGGREKAAMASLVLSVR